MYYEIDEQIAAEAHSMVFFSDYEPGSATAGYRAAVDAAYELVTKQKAKTSPFYHDKLDALFDSYSKRLASWTNAYNRNTASCPSVLISGPANFPTGKKEKQNAREGALWDEYKEIEQILDKIQSVGTGPVDLTDPDARQMLQDRLDKTQETLAKYKELNAYYRKHKNFSGCPCLSEDEAVKLSAEFEETKKNSPWMDKPFPDYELTSLRNKIKRLEARLAELDKLEAEQKEPAKTIKFDGGEIVLNAELNRLQIIFDEIPDPEIRNDLKSHGFRWSPANKAWQRQLTRNAEYAAERILKLA